MNRLLALLLLLVLPACAREAVVGPNPLRGDEHMREFLAEGGARQATLDDGETLYWSFDEAGTCAAWIEGEGFADLHFALWPGFPEGERRLDARWTADTERLRLTKVVNAESLPLRDWELDLGWVDGKFMIDIAGRRFGQFD